MRGAQHGRVPLFEVAAMSKRCYLRGWTLLGLFNSVIGCLFNRVLVRIIDHDTGKTLRRRWDKADQWPLEKESMTKIDTKLKESLARCLHERIWAGWMSYMFSKGTLNADGTWTMPKWAVDRWTRQMNTPYAELPEPEKTSDRELVDPILWALEWHKREIEKEVQ